MKVSESEVSLLCPTLWDPMDCSLAGFSVHGIFQARVLEWVAISFSQITPFRVGSQANCVCLVSRQVNAGSERKSWKTFLAICRTSHTSRGISALKHEGSVQQMLSLVLKSYCTLGHCLYSIKLGVCWYMFPCFSTTPCHTRLMVSMDLVPSPIILWTVWIQGLLSE